MSNKTSFMLIKFIYSLELHSFVFSLDSLRGE